MWNKFFKPSLDLLIPLSIGALALGFSWTDRLAILRWISGFIFVFIASGFPLTRLLPARSDILDKLIVASAASLLLTYPAVVLTVMLEGGSSEAIFGRHLSTSMASLFVFSLLLSLVFIKRKSSTLHMMRFPPLLLIPLTLYTALTFMRLNRADAIGDEYDLGYQAYNLVDGIKAGRKALTISYSGHPPLSMSIKHFSMNILESDGLDLLNDWQFRVSEGLVGIITLVVVYAFIRGTSGRYAALLGTILLSVNNDMVWMGRIFHREMYMTFFMAVAAYFLSKAVRTHKSVYTILAGLGLGGSLIVKETAVVLVAAFVMFAVFHRRLRAVVTKLLLIAFLIFLPVLVFNIAAYLTTGYADVFFSNILGVSRPGATPVEMHPVTNLLSMATFLWDIYSPPIVLLLITGLAQSLVSKKKPIDELMFLWIVSTLLFFSLTAIRSYYFLFLLIPLTIVLSRTILLAPRRGIMIVVSVVGLYSLYYSYNTNVSRSYTRAQDIGRIDGALFLRHPAGVHYSLAARSWVEEVGYKRLQVKLNEVISEEDCLLVSDSINSLAARRYLFRQDAIKEHYLGPNYPTRYPRCPQDPTMVHGRRYLISANRNELGNVETTITDHLGNERFFLFRLDTEDLMI